jgi:hypothetical protein
VTVSFGCGAWNRHGIGDEIYISGSSSERVFQETYLDTELMLSCQTLDSIPAAFQLISAPRNVASPNAEIPTPPLALVPSLGCDAAVPQDSGTSYSLN